MTAPGFKVEVGYESTWQTEPHLIAWTDETTRVAKREHISTKRGSSNIWAEPDTGQVNWAFRNTDRRFDPLHDTGPLFGELLPGTPYRVSAVFPGETFTLEWNGDPLEWNGDPLVFTEADTVIPIISGTFPKWPQRSERGNTYGWVPMVGYERTDKLSRAKIPQSVGTVEVLADNPTAYWRLNEANETDRMLDSSGNGNDGDYENAELGLNPLVVDDGGSMGSGLNDDTRGWYEGTGLPQGPPCSWEAWVRLDRAPGEIQTIMAVQRDTAVNTYVAMRVYPALSPNGEVLVSFDDLGGGYVFRGHTRVDDGEVHHVVLTMSSTAASGIRLYVDGALQTKTVITGTTGGSWASHLLWTVGNMAPGNIDRGLGGEVDDVAVYPTVLSADRVLAHYEAGFLPLVGQRVDERMTYILDSLGWPDGFRDFEEGRTVLGPATFVAGDAALSYLQLLTQTEDGRLFTRPGGELRFLDRYWRYLATEATVSQFTFTDGAGPGYAEFELDPADDELMVNTARYTRRDGVQQVATDQASVELYGEAEENLTDLLHASDTQTRAQAQWRVATSSVPQPSIKKLRIGLHTYSEADQLAVLNLDQGHRVTAQRTPQGVGTQIELDFVVAGIDHDIGPARTEWWVDLYVSPAPDMSAELFLMSDSALSGVDILAF